MVSERIKVCVVDMQPIDPPVGGGRLRLLGLYHALGAEFQTTYVGSYDWPGESYREVRHSETLLEVTVPLSAEHFRANAELQQALPGKTIIDVTFAQLVHLSPDYLREVEARITEASIVVFSHPWTYRAVSACLRKDQLVVYDSQNCEGIVKAQMLDVSPSGAELVRQVVECEYAILRRADLVLACSSDDLVAFNTIYEIPRSRIIVVPNGVFADRILPASLTERHRARSKLGIGYDDIALFIGSAYEPNVAAARYLCELAPHFPAVGIVLCGGVGAALAGGNRPPNVLITGQVSDDTRNEYLRAANIALNPMTAGSGTNIKMFDFMAAGLAIIATPTGHRGIVDSSDAPAFVSAEIAEFPAAVRALLEDPERQQVLGRDARALVADIYAWESLSVRLGRTLRERFVEVCRSTNQAPRRLCLMSSWGRRCGISEYSTYLLDALLDADLGYEISLIVSEGYSNDAAPFERSEVAFTKVGWNFDNLLWSHGYIDVRGILDFIEQRQVEFFVLQYHPGFFSEKSLVELTNGATALEAKVYVVLHNSRLINLSATGLLDPSIVVYVHTEDERRVLADRLPTVVRRFTHGTLARTASDEVTRSPDISLRIGTFGFLRPHKGVLELISILPQLIAEFGSVELHAHTALYPSDDSKLYLKECLAQIKALGLAGIAFIDTEYVDIHDAIERLATCDLIVLPYAESDEGSSAAARTAFASGRPVIVTPSTIFSDIEGFAYRARGFKRTDIADAIRDLVLAPSLYAEYRRRAEDFCNENSWKAAALMLHRELTATSLASDPFGKTRSTA